MKRENFVRAIETYQDTVIKSLLRKTVDVEMAHDATQEAVVTLLENKSYQNIDYEAIDGRILSFLKTTAKFVIKNMLTLQEIQNGTFVSVASERETVREKEQQQGDIRERTVDAQECPYCHSRTLNQYKACACGIILGQGKAVRKVEHVSIDEADLASLPNLDLTIDVANAMATLEPLEKKVIEAIANKADTLDGLAGIHGMSRDNLWRVYVQAKRKLQAILFEYA